MAGKLEGTAIEAGTVTNAKLAADVSAVIQAGGGPKITGVTYPGDDTAANTVGGQTIIVTGSGFNPGVAVYIGNLSGANQAPTVSRANSNYLSFTTPALAANIHKIYVVNTDGGVGTYHTFQVSGEPTWVTNTSLGQFVVSANISKQLEATSDSNVTYTLASGSSLPSGMTLASNGLIGGALTSPPGSETSYNFSVVATDQENQNSTKAFTYTGIVFTFSISPAVDGNSNIALTTGSTLAINSNGFYTITPLGDFSANVQVWGAGGGGSVDGGLGGGGGYSAGIVSFKSGVSYNVVVGSGGFGSPSGRAAGAGGAGSGIRFVSNSTAIIVAGGGGGGWASGRSGGGGGGTTGQTGQVAGSGGGPGGTQSAAGVGVYGGRRTGASGSGPNGGGGGTGSPIAAGGVGYGSGGVGAYNGGDAGSGGGGGGYWGGAEGGGDSGAFGGGGGSGHINPLVVTSGYTETAALNVAGANSNASRSGAGNGGPANGNRAANGRIVITGI
jgi:hypothetical protein